MPCNVIDQVDEFCTTALNLKFERLYSILARITKGTHLAYNRLLPIIIASVFAAFAQQSQAQTAKLLADEFGKICLRNLPDVEVAAEEFWNSGY